MFGELEGRKNKYKEVTQKNKEGSPNPLIKCPDGSQRHSNLVSEKLMGATLLEMYYDIGSFHIKSSGKNMKSNHESQNQLKFSASKINKSIVINLLSQASYLLYEVVDE